jgi:hypothetical protein
MRPLRRQVARTLDFGMCLLMNRIQRRHRLTPQSRSLLEAYLDDCERLTPEEFYAAPAPALTQTPEPGLTVLEWDTPRPSGFAANDRTHTLLFMHRPGAPTVMMLHALASASDKGYRAWARRFNEAGLNACFVHLPYHYSRIPEGCYNGELAITPDLIRTAEGLRQGVTELRQLMTWLRRQGTREFGLWATSYGGWIGALLLGIEPDFRFAVLQAPIVNVSHAIWESAAARHVAAELARNGITPTLVERHEHLTFPMHVRPACGPERVLLASGVWDRISRADDISALHRAWPGSELISVEQGHFGFRMADACFRHLATRGLLDGVN